MIDVASRLKACNLLEKILTDEISNYALDDSWPESHDPSISAIFDIFYGYYDDFPEKIIMGSGFSSDLVKTIERSISFLASSCEYEWPPFRFTYFPTLLSKLLRSEEKWRKEYEKFKKCGDFDVWPFFRESDYTSVLLTRKPDPKQ